MVAPFAVAVAALLFSPASTAAAAPVSVSSLRPVRQYHAWSKEIHRSSLGASVGLGDFTWDCTQFSGDDQSMCGLCDQHWSLSGDCFWCSETSTCHDQTDWLFNDKAASCVEMACVSENGDDGCSGSCAQGTVPSGFSVPRAQSLLALANASIYQGKTLSIALQELGFPPGAYQVVANATLQAQAIVVPLPDSNAITIALRGKQFLSPNDTHILNDTLVNFTQAVSASQPNRTAAWQVGSGAAAAYGSLREQLHAAVEWAVGVVGPTRPAVYVTGHSLGGSIAEIAAPELALSSLSTSLDSVSVTTFGALRACNPVFAEQVTQLVPAWWTVQNFFDVFCHAPYRWLGFAHVPGIVVVGPNQGNVHEVTPADDDNYWVSDVADPLLFHQPAAYSTQLSALPGAAPGGRFALQRL